jgi:hypothetical protein
VRKIVSLLLVLLPSFGAVAEATERTKLESLAAKAFELTGRKASPEEANTCVLQTISCGQTINGSLDPGDCALGDGSVADFFQFNGTVGQAVDATLTSFAFPVLLDLLDPTPTNAAFNTGATSARVQFTLTSSGTWAWGVTNSNPFFESGNYTLAFTCPGGSEACPASALCIDQNPGDRRFQIKVSYNTSQGGGLSGSGNPIALSGEGVTEGGLFWFFGATNPEMLIKIIDGCSLGGHFWVFYAATTNVGFTVTVTDTQTGHQVTYTNPDGHAAPPKQDTSALTCP